MTEKELLNWVQQDKPKEIKYSEEDVVPDVFEINWKNKQMLVTSDTFSDNVNIKVENGVTTIDFSKCTENDINKWADKMWSKRPK